VIEGAIPRAMNEAKDPAPSHETELPPTMSSAMASATRYHAYLWSFVQPSLGQRVLEIGVGFGQYTRRMLADGRRVLGCDLDAGLLEALKLSTHSPLLETLRLDLQNPEAARQSIAAFAPDTIILLNVLEHIQNDQEALAFLRDTASPGGRVVLIVPALRALYNGLDREAGHHRRYSRASLERTLSAAGWDIVETRYINLPGVPGWLAAGWLSRASRLKTELNASSTNWLLRFYDRFFVGLSRLTDPVASKLGGLSVQAVAKKV
jgi:2-polyprenyl-3-methyl-5-hydroxy-6-metoxy-1,4-benzoquinol methylase